MFGDGPGLKIAPVDAGGAAAGGDGAADAVTSDSALGPPNS